MLTRSALFTSPSEVDDFLAAGINLLAPSIGNVHGDYPASAPQLHFDGLDSIRAQVADRVHIAPHGTNDFPTELMQQCIEHGAVKLDVNKLLLDCWSDHIRKHARDSIVKLTDDGMSVLQKETEGWMYACGSAGKA